VLRAQTGDRAALDEVLRSVQHELFAYLAHYTSDAHLAEDILQDTFLIACRQLKWLRHPEYFRTWIFRIATREAWRRMHAERRRRGVPLSESAEPAAADASRPGNASEIRHLRENIEALPPNSRAVVLLHYGAGLTLSEAAAVLDVPEGTVKSRLAYALALLRERTPK
jgi:RNA polymerase sigma factor (sigma-70 family)